MRIAILSTHGIVKDFLDDFVPEALGFTDAKLHQYTSAAETLEFITDCRHPTAALLKVGNILSFILDGIGHYLTIKRTERSGNDLSVYAESLTLELSGEEIAPFSNPQQTFIQHLRSLNIEDAFYVAVNETEGLSRSWALEGYNSALACLYSLATTFDSEIEIKPVLKNYVLDRLELSIYRDREAGGSGLGRNNSGTVLKVGKEIQTMNVTEDMTEFCSAVRPVGEEELTLAGFVKGYEDEFLLEGEVIKSPEARNQYPSTLNGVAAGRYVSKTFNVNTKSQAVLYREGARYLRRNCRPKVIYEISGNVNGDIGDTFTIRDERGAIETAFKARITEKIVYPQAKYLNEVQMEVI